MNGKRRDDGIVKKHWRAQRLSLEIVRSVILFGEEIGFPVS